jgi:protease IV
MAFSNILRNIFWVLILLQFAPPLLKSIKHSYSDMMKAKTKVGIITIKNTINDSTTYAGQLKKFFEDTEIKAILIKFDCPGGSAGASQALFNEIKELKKQYLKPVISWVQSVCASGGYYIATASDHIIATPAAIVGSVGVYLPHPQLKEFIEQFKLKYSVISAGKFKTAGDPFLATTPEQEKHLKETVENTYHQFVNDVAAQRPKLTIATSATWADGKIFTGQQALKLGLIDELGSQITAERCIKKKAQIGGEIQWVRPTCKSSLLKMLSSSDCDNNDDGSEDTTYIEQAVNTACAYVDTRLHSVPQ